MRSQVFALCVFLCCANGANVLGIFDLPSRSLHILGHALMAGLARKGFNTTMLSAFPLEESTPNYTHIEIEELMKFKTEKLGSRIQGVPQVSALALINFQYQLTKISLESRRLQDLMNSKDTHFDLIILYQTYVMNEAYLGLAHRFRAPVIAFAPFSGLPNLNRLTGNSEPYSYVPLGLSKFTQHMTFFERTANTLLGLAVNLLHEFYLLPRQDALLRAVFPDAPPVEELLQKIGLVFVNTHVSTETPRPYPPNVIQIGGYHLEELDPPSGSLLEILNGAEEGVVYMSFGSNVQSSMLPQETLDVFVKKFGELPLTVLWKYESKHLQNKPANVLTFDWLPQRSVLAHPNVKVFVSHGGMGSITEALYFGIPLLCVPFYGDQEKNCQEAAAYGYGLMIRFDDLDETKFSQSLDEILLNPKEQPVSPMDKVAFWVNYVIKHKGAGHLRTKAGTMPWYQYFLMDVAAFILETLTVALMTLYFVLACCARKIFGSGKKHVKAKWN